MESEVRTKARAAHEASRQLANADSAVKNKALYYIAEELESRCETILAANRADLAHAKANGMSEAMLDRLALTKARIADMATGVRSLTCQILLANVWKIGRGPMGFIFRKLQFPWASLPWYMSPDPM